MLRQTTTRISTLRAAFVVSLWPAVVFAQFSAEDASATASEQQSAPPPESPPPKSGQLPRQEQNKEPESPVSNERWNLFYQATSIGEYHGRFRSPYTGTYSLLNIPERDVSLTTTLFLGLRLERNTLLYFNPEMAGGKGFSGTNGIANFPNGEITRVAGATPKPYIARLYISHDFGFGSETESFESEENQLAGERPVVRYTVTVGRFTVTDFFDNNRYTHDPRTQFMAWGTMYNGAWDYPADTRGYTWGWVHEFHTANWSFRYGSAFEPKVANGMQFDRRILRDRADVWEQERRWLLRKHPGAIRTLEYLNHAAAGTYGTAIALAHQNGGTPDVVATRKIGTIKYGFGINAEQEVTKNVGIFTRLAWNDGKTESFAFTAIDRLASAGISLVGEHWRRRFDTAGLALTVAGLSRVHANYLAQGGLDFLIGDGRLNYAPEYVTEGYYTARLFRGVLTTFDVQHVANPAFNQDRGPVWIPSMRLHIELGKPDFKAALGGR
ncbi:MAG: carbohydrate porin [Acidobacteriaceae bacterium]|nr:carbohydrate porin [Acidobacteriaceae bacterium]